MVTLKGNNGTYEGTSEDNKPLNVPVNTEYYELDTGKTYYFDGEAWQEEPPCEGGGFTPTSAQLAAMNSGITEEDVTQIGVNENNILSLYKSGSANILKNTAQSQTVGGVTFTMNADGTITANGTKTDNEWLYLSTGNSLKAGTYVLSSGGVIGDDKLVIVTTGNTLGTAIMTTNTATGIYERELTQDYSGLYYAIRIASGTVCDNLTFKPMLCEKNVYEAINGEFQPYAMTNAEITAWILAHS